LLVGAGLMLTCLKSLWIFTARAVGPKTRSRLVEPERFRSGAAEVRFAATGGDGFIFARAARGAVAPRMVEG
jgi:hypothetical protein